MNTQIQHNSKSLLTSPNLGYDIEQEEIKTPNYISYEENPNITMNTGFAKQETIEQVPIILQLQQDNPIKLPKNSVLDDVETGFGKYQKIEIECKHPEIEEPETEEKPPPIVIFHADKPTYKEDSILDNVDSGYGSENKVVVECKKPQFKTHLFKENYLGEFTKETEKALVRNNIGVYSKNEVREVVSHIISDSSLITRSEVQNIVEDLDFVDSVVRSHASYNIPNDLFQL